MLNYSFEACEGLVFTDLQGLNFSPCCSDAEAYSQVCQHTVTSLMLDETFNQSVQRSAALLKGAL